MAANSCTIAAAPASLLRPASRNSAAVMSCSVQRNAARARDRGIAIVVMCVSPVMSALSINELVIKKKAPLLFQFRQQPVQLLHLLRCERTEQLVLRPLMNLAASGVRAPSGIRQYRETGATIVRIGLAAHQPIGFKSIDQLGHIRFHARQPLRKLTQRK